MMEWKMIMTLLKTENIYRIKINNWDFIHKWKQNIHTDDMNKSTNWILQFAIQSIT